MLRGFVILRVVVFTTLLLSALLIQLTFSVALPLNLIYYLAALAYSVSIVALFSIGRIPPVANATLQILGDLMVITGLVYISRGPDSGFTFLYFASVSAGAILLGRQGGFIAAGLSAVFYAVLVDLMFWNVLPFVESPDFPQRVWSVGGLVGNVAMNVSAFFATAFLVVIASEKLHQARADLVRRNSEISRLQALHTSVLTSMSSGVLTTDMNGEVTYANPAALELLHKSLLDLIGTHILALGLIDPTAWETVRRSDSDLVRFEGNRTALGPDSYFGVSATVLREGEGRTTGRIFIFQNLTDLKKLESEIRLKEKMAAVGELAAGIAHEIRNPLASISGSVQVLRGSSVPGSSDQRLMEIVVNESQRLSTILEDFLRYVRPREKAIEAVDGPAALRDVLTLLQHSDERSPQHRFVIRLDPESLTVAADPGQLRQIFWNLARNALAAMPGGGTLTVSARAVSNGWVVSMADEGRGMTEDERDRLFTPFAHTFPGGTGLGLAIVFRIVEEHGGTIRVDTAPGHGTTISISFPLGEPMRQSEDSGKTEALRSTLRSQSLPAREVA